MAEDQDPASSIVDEMRLLGQQLGAAAKALWDSEEAHVLRQQVREGLTEASRQIDAAAQSFQDSEAAQQFGAQVRHGVQQARESHAGAQVEEGIVLGLQEINRQLGKLLDSWSSRPAAENPPPPPPEPGASA